MGFIGLVADAATTIHRISKLRFGNDLAIVFPYTGIFRSPIVQQTGYLLQKLERVHFDHRS